VLLALEPALAIPVAQAFAELGFATGLAFTTNQVAALASDVEVLVGDESVDPSGTVLMRLAQDVGAACVFVPSNSVQTTGKNRNATIGPAASIVARVLAAIDERRWSTSDDVLAWGQLEMRPSRRSARWCGRPIHLTPTEFDILCTLVRARGSVVPKRDLQRAVWPHAEPDDGERLHAHIRRIRSHLERDSAHPTFLLTARGIGFRLADVDDGMHLRDASSAHKSA
jgi:DNA-binding winged helix-turn-helix (wHTH) protein